jgi:hypothetical protein
MKSLLFQEALEQNNLIIQRIPGGRKMIILDKFLKTNLGDNKISRSDDCEFWYLNNLI